MSEVKERRAAQDFADFWRGKGYEKGQSQPFWLSLLRDVLGVEHRLNFLRAVEKFNQKKPGSRLFLFCFASCIAKKTDCNKV